MTRKKQKKTNRLHKKIDGKKYKIVGRYDTKATAQKSAKHMRKSGHSVRVNKGHKNKYELWKR